MPVMRMWLVVAVFGGGCLVGCRPPAARLGGFDSLDPASKLYAVRRAGEARDRGAVADLVEQLDSDDPAVRMFTINALERITGERLGYDPYAGPAGRREAADAWAQAVRSGRFE